MSRHKEIFELFRFDGESLWLSPLAVNLEIIFQVSFTVCSHVFLLTRSHSTPKLACLLDCNFGCSPCGFGSFSTFYHLPPAENAEPPTHLALSSKDTLTNSTKIILAKPLETWLSLIHPPRQRFKYRKRLQFLIC